jgi:hypothetical protein
LSTWKEKKKKMWPLCRAGPWAKAPLPRAPGNYARQLWKNFPSSGVHSFAERSCTGRSTKIFFKKKLKTVFADSLCQVRSAQNFLKKIEKEPLPTALLGALGTGFFKKNKTPLFADGLETISKTVNLTRR